MLRTSLPQCSEYEFGSTRISNPDHLPLHSTRVGHWAEEIERCRNANLASWRASETKGWMKCWRKAETDSSF
jgi:hypothetical protein